MHWTAYLCWPVAFLHGLGTGTDTREALGLFANVGCLLVILVAIWWRVGATRGVSAGRRVTATLASFVVAFGVVAWMLLEPMQPGWARKAGTPSELLTAAPGVASSAAALRAPMSSGLLGSIREDDADGSGRATVTIDADVRAVPGARLEVVISGAALRDGGVSMSASSVRLASSVARESYQGRVARLDGNEVVAVVDDAFGHRMTLTMRFVNDGSNRITGTLTARTGGLFDGR